MLLVLSTTLRNMYDLSQDPQQTDVAEMKNSSFNFYWYTTPWSPFPAALLDTVLPGDGKGWGNTELPSVTGNRGPLLAWKRHRVFLKSCRLAGQLMGGTEIHTPNVGVTSELSHRAPGDKHCTCEIIVSYFSLSNISVEHCHLSGRQVK